MSWMQNLIRGLGTQNAPFGFDAMPVTGNPSQFDPAYGAGMQMLGNIGAGMLANINENPAKAFGRAYLGAQEMSRENNKQDYVAAQMLQQAEDKKREQQAEREQQEQFNAWVETLPPEQQGLARMFPDKFGAAYIKQQMPDPQGTGGVELGMTPIPLSDGNGNWAVGQLSPQGGVLVNGKPAGSQWKYDPYGLAFDKSKGGKEGAGSGEAGVSYESMNAKLPGLETVITKLDDLAEKATYTLAGQVYNWGRTQTGMAPSEGQVARTEYQATVANQILPLLRDTFGAQFTAREGDTLMATLGDPDKTPKEKQAVLKAFIEQKRRDIQALGVQSGKLPPPGGSDPLSQARAAIAAGADPAKVRQRLIDNGIDPSGL